MELAMQDPWTLQKMRWVAKQCRDSSPAEIDALIRELQEAYDLSVAMMEGADCQIKEVRMNGERFDKIVKARANERAVKKINEFKTTVYKALDALLPGAHRRARESGSRMTVDAKKIFELIANEETKGWPSTIWNIEREAVTKEILTTLNEMQRALLAADRAGILASDPQEEVTDETTRAT